MMRVFSSGISTAAGALSTVALFALVYLSLNIDSIALRLSTTAAVLIAWTMSLYVLYLLVRRKEAVEYADMLTLIYVTALAFLGLVNVIEVSFIRIILIIGGGILIGLLYNTKLYESMILSHQLKPYRRMKMMLWVFDTFALAVVVFALSIFFPGIPFWILSIVTGFLMGVSATLIWRMYYDVPFKTFGLWLVIVSLIMVQLTWVMHFLPLGYLSVGFLLTWMWYLLQLFVRFHLSRKGIIWKKQARFLITNAALFTLVLFIVRWI